MKEELSILEQYKKFVSQIAEVSDIKVNLDQNEQGVFKDDKIQFGFIVYTLEKKRVEVLLGDITTTVERGYDDMYHLGQQSILEEF